MLTTSTRAGRSRSTISPARYQHTYIVFDGSDESVTAIDRQTDTRKAGCNLSVRCELTVDPLTQVHRRRRVEATLDRFAVLSFDVEAAEYYGTLAALVRQYGRNQRPRRMDRQIAATAARHGLMLLTRNDRNFAGLQSALHVVDLPNQP